MSDTSFIVFYIWYELINLWTAMKLTSRKGLTVTWKNNMSLKGVDHIAKPIEQCQWFLEIITKLYSGFTKDKFCAARSECIPLSRTSTFFLFGLSQNYIKSENLNSFLGQNNEKIYGKLSFTNFVWFLKTGYPPIHSCPTKMYMQHNVGRAGCSISTL